MQFTGPLFLYTGKLKPEQIDYNETNQYFFSLSDRASHVPIKPVEDQNHFLTLFYHAYFLGKND